MSKEDVVRNLVRVLVIAGGSDAFQKRMPVISHITKSCDIFNFFNFFFVFLSYRVWGGCRRQTIAISYIY